MLHFLAFFPLLAVLIVSHELGHFLVAKALGVPVQEFGLGFPPRILAMRWRGTEYSLNLLPLGGFVRMEGEETLWDTSGLDQRGPWTRLGVVAAGPAMNGLLALVVFWALFIWPRTTVVGEVMVNDVASGSPAALAGILPGDIIVAANGEPADSMAAVRYRIYGHLGEEVTLTLRRGEGQHLVVRVVPRADPPQGEGAVGVVLGYFEPRPVTISYPPWEALGRATGYCIYILELTRQSLLGMLFSGDLSQVAGPVGIAQFTAEAAKSGLAALLEWTAVLSLNLALVNLLPIPVLDGGRIVFIAIEVLRRGRRISPQRESIVHLIGFVILITLIILVSYNDILRWLRVEGLFQ